MKDAKLYLLGKAHILAFHLSLIRHEETNIFISA